ncbi:MAG: DUF1015 domain-containing protein [Oligoflexia bacterium]|nr:DUF1015 domain-containing protein [Oligoflexia bacterium]
MTEIRAFKGWRYSQAKASDYSKLIVPPYDVISDQELSEMKKLDSHNFSHVILAEGENKHQKASRLLESMKKEDLVVQESRPCFYLYRQTFKLNRWEKFCQDPTLPDQLSRVGFFALVKLHDYSDKVILPHEKTFAGPKADRYDLMTMARGQMEPVFLGYDSDFLGSPSEFKALFSQKPDVGFKDQFGVTHEMWACSDEEFAQRAKSEIKNLPLFILDGHHRYETALKYSKDHPEGTARYVLAQLIPFQQQGTVILPTHRVLKWPAPPEKITDFLYKHMSFELVDNLEQLETRMRSGARASFGAILPQGIYYSCVKRSTENLDLDNLHKLIIPALTEKFGEPRITYVKSIEECVDSVKKGAADLAFLVRPSTHKEVMSTANQGLVMPHKSTFFFPKVPSGLVIHCFEK